MDEHCIIYSDVNDLFGASESDAAQVSALIMAGASVIGYVIGEGIADNGNNYLQVIGEECEEKMEE